MRRGPADTQGQDSGSGRETDLQIARDIFGHDVSIQNKGLHEMTENGEIPLRHYSQEMQWAWVVAEKMRISIIPVENGNWFAFAGPLEGWSSPEAFLDFLRHGDFSQAGASVGPNAAQVICEAALVAHQKRKPAHSEDLKASQITLDATASEEPPASLH